MIAFLLTFLTTFFHEASQSIGKKSVTQKRETAQGFVFLSSFWGLIVMLAIVALGPPVHFSFESLPTLVPRILLTLILAYLGAEAVIRSQRSTYGFLRLLSIPLILVVDLVLGYAITPLQIAGILTLFVSLAIAFRHNVGGRKGAGIILLWVILGVVDLSLYKYNITHFNSVMVEQAVVHLFVTVFFYSLMLARGQSPVKLLFSPVTGTQAILGGASIVIGSFAFALAPASVITALKRASSLMWSVIFGQFYFHEGTLRRKLYSYAVAVIGILLLASPYIAPISF